MIIQCPSCQARFMLPDEALGDAGKKVRCAKCRDVWFQKAPAVSARAQETESPFKPAHPAAGLPVPTKKRSVAHEWVVFSLCFSWLMFASLYLFGPVIVQKIDFAAPVYLPLGIVNTEGVVLADTKVEKMKQYGRQSVSLSGMIVNEATEPRRVPNLQITQKGRDGEILETSILESGFPLLAPGKEINYHNVMPLASQDVSHIIVDLGDSIELSRRNKN